MLAIASQMSAGDSFQNQHIKLWQHFETAENTLKQLPAIQSKAAALILVCSSASKQNKNSWKKQHLDKLIETSLVKHGEHFFQAFH